MRPVLTALLRVAKCLPQKLATWLGRGVGTILRLAGFRRRIIVCQLALAFPSLTAPERARLMAGYYRHLGLLAMELLRLPGVSSETVQRLVEFTGEQHLREALAKGRGVLLFTGHLGNWELAGVTLARHGYRLKAIGKEMKTPAGNTFIQMIRDDNGVPTLPRRGGMKQILKALKDNEIIVVLIDQNMTAEEGIFADFFGVPASTMAATAILAERTGATVLPGHMWRDPDDLHHHLEILPPVALEQVSQSAAVNVQHNTARFNAILESLVNRQPAQWMWIHKRWKTRPPDESPCRIQY